MTAKDYEKLAAAIWRAKQDAQSSARYSGDDIGFMLQGVELAEDCLAEVLQADNPRFNLAMWRMGCLGR